MAAAIKMAEIIFDLKEKLTDSEYIEIMDWLKLIHDEDSRVLKRRLTLQSAEMIRVILMVKNLQDKILELQMTLTLYKMNISELKFKCKELNLKPLRKGKELLILDIISYLNKMNVNVI